jgi:hypothetical protein
MSDPKKHETSEIDKKFRAAELLRIVATTKKNAIEAVNARKFCKQEVRSSGNIIPRSEIVKK